MATEYKLFDRVDHQDLYLNFAANSIVTARVECKFPVYEMRIKCVSSTLGADADGVIAKIVSSIDDRAVGVIYAVDAEVSTSGMTEFRFTYQQPKIINNPYTFTAKYTQDTPVAAITAKVHLFFEFIGKPFKVPIA